METSTPVEQVRCLACGTPYAKPQRGGTVRTNPGCPECGYVGWSPVAAGVSARVATTRSDAGRPLRRVVPGR